MGKLAKLFIFAVCILSISVLFIFNQNSSDLNSLTVESASPSSQSFGRGFAKNDPKLLGEIADPNYKISFPKDHNSHNSFDIEWWYLTANLQDKEGNDYGLQWTLFRFRNPNLENASDTKKSNWNNEHLYMAHASVHSESEHWFSEKFARGNVGNAGIQNSPFKLFIDDWQWSSPNDALLPANLSFNTKLIATKKNKTDSTTLNVQLHLSNTGPYILQGKEGYSIKSENGKHASHYYSAPFIKIDGVFSINKESSLSSNKPKLEVKTITVKVKGNAWFDQEWTSQLFDQATLGWDWFSLHLDNGDKIMVFRMRLKNQPEYFTGTYINSDGSTTELESTDIELDSIQLTEVGTAKLPLDWELKIKSKKLNLNIKAIKNDQWNPGTVAYYEGAVEISGTSKGKGFMELTGY